MKNYVAGCRSAAFLLAVGFASVVCATDYTWTGNGELGNWNDSNNWELSSAASGAGTSAAVPGAGDTALFTQGTYEITSGIALGGGILTIKLGEAKGDAVTNTISGNISGIGGIRIEGSCTNTPSIKTQVEQTAKWNTVMILGGDNSYSGGTTVTNSLLRGDSTTAFGAADSDVLFAGRTSLAFNAKGNWRSYKYIQGHTANSGSDYPSICFLKYADWNGSLTSKVKSNSNGYRLFIVASVGATANINAAITLPSSNVYPCVDPFSANTKMNFFNSVHVKEFRQTGVGAIGGACNFYSKGNQYELTQIGYGFNVRCMTDRLLDESRVLNYGGNYGKDGYGYFDLYGYDQQAKGLTSTATSTDYTEAGNYLRCTKSGSAATMWLVGAKQNCLFRGRVEDNVSIVWNPDGEYTQVFSNRTHTMTGRFVVSNGTIRVAGKATFKNVPEIVVAKNAKFECFSTEADCFSGLKSLIIEDGATFTVGEETPKPFADGEIDLVIKGSGKLVIPSGMSVRMKKLNANGLYPGATDIYTSDSNVDWFAGGEISAINENITSWKSAINGNWSDETKWTDGVPAEGKTAYITVGGNDYTVTIGEDAVLNKRLVVGGGANVATLAISATAAMTNGYINVNDGGVISVNENGSLLYEGKGDGVRTDTELTEVIAIKGGELLVDGGAVDFRDMSGRIVVSDGENGGKGKITVRDGSIFYNPDTGSDYFRIEEGGFVDMSGGTFLFDGYNPAIVNDVGFRLNGGEMCITGGVFGVVKFADNSHTNRINFHQGSVVFGGDAILQLCEIRGFDNKCYFSPTTSGESLYFRMEGRAKVQTNSNDFRVLHLGGQVSNPSIVMDWMTSATNEAYRMNVGQNRSGTYVFNLTNSTFEVGEVGLRIGFGDSTDAAPENPVHGICNVLNGGELVIDGKGAVQKGYLAWSLCGLAVGYSGRSKVTSGKIYEGELNIDKGGLVRTLYGDMGVGVGFAKGSVTIDGGTLNFNDHETKSSYKYQDTTCGIGMFGGEGSVTVKNGGSFASLPDVFVGGAITNRFPIQGINFLNYSSQKMAADSSATGTLEVADATVKFKQNLVVGMDGFGIVRRIGSEGAFEVGNIVCTNIEERVYTGSRFDFVLDENGIGPITVADRVSIFGNASVNVDMSAYNGKKRSFKLIDCTSHSGEFDSVSITGVNFASQKPWLEWSSRGLRLKMSVGTVISLR